jgi:hypothetical protein
MRKLADICRMSWASFLHMHLLAVGPMLMNLFSLNNPCDDKHMNILSDGSATHTQLVMFTVFTTGGVNPALVLRRMLSFRKDTYVNVIGIVT